MEPSKGTLRLLQPPPTAPGLGAVVPSPDPFRRDEDLGYDLHEGPGQLLAAIQLLACRCADELPSDSPWKARIQRMADLAERGKRELDRIARGLTLSPRGGDPLPGALRKLAGSFESDSGITVLYRVRGTAGPLPAPAEAALFRIANQALTNAWRHARCEAVRLELSFQPLEVALTVADDGVGLGRRWQARGGHLGMASMRRAAERVGGTFRIRGLSPHGVVIEARVPLEAER